MTIEEDPLFHRQLLRRAKTTRRKLAKVRAELEKAKRWPEVRHEADLLQNNFHLIKRGMEMIAIADWESGEERQILLYPELGAEEQIKQRYKTARKGERAIPHLEREIVKLEGAQARWEQLLARWEEGDVEGLREASGLEVPGEPVAKPPPPPKGVRRFYSASGVIILVGKGAEGNDRLSFQIARGNDTWLHANDVGGAHVVICAKDPNQETLKDALQLALRYSQAKGDGEVVTTHAKNLRRIRGHLGKVSLAQPRVHFVRVDEPRLSAIRARTKQWRESPRGSGSQPHGPSQSSGS